jgi:uncharacterized protein (DUF58 family)
MPSAEVRRREPWPDRWIRSSCSDAITLNLRNVYIVPSRFGWLWLLTTAVLALLGAWAQRGSVLLLAAGCLALVLLAPSLTQANLQGLELRCGDPAMGFAGATVHYPLELHSRCQRLRLRVFFQRSRPQASGRPAAQPAAWQGSTGAGVSTLLVPWIPDARGPLRPGRLRLESQAPLGLFQCWTLWEPARPQLVAPTPALNSTHAAAFTGGASGEGSWDDLVPHRAEEGSTRLAWKQLARTGERLSKRFRDADPVPPWLSPDPALPWEQALQQLCGACLLLHRAGVPFGLTVADVRIEAATGAEHLQRCLRGLALAPRP